MSRAIPEPINGVSAWMGDEDSFHVLLNDPERRNAQDPQLWQRLVEVATSIPDAARFVVIEGAGRDFSAGLNKALFDPSSDAETLWAVARRDDAGRRAFIDQAQRAFRIWQEIPAVSISLVQGNAIGAGFALALACDFMITTPAAHLELREPKLGIIADLGASARLVPALGFSRALLVEAGVPLTGKQAHDWGISIACADDLAAAMEVLRGELQQAQPAALRAAKELVRRVHAGDDPWLTEQQVQSAHLEQLVRLMGQHG